MGRNTKLHTIACALVVAWIVAAGPVRAQESASRAPVAANKKPNIVFILVGNVGWGNFGVYGGTIPTPRIDKMASEGIGFTNYNVEAQCTPTQRC
jgi:hypothetical protein